MFEKINVVIDRVCYSSAKSDGFFLIIRTDIGTCKGKMSYEPTKGEKITFNGKWGVYQGQREFQFTGFVPFIPENLKSKLEYVCELAKGIGPATALKIWDKYGDDWQAISKDDENGILKGEKFKEFKIACELLVTNEFKINTITYLTGKGLSINMAEKAWDKWGREAVGVVDNNPYKLATLPNYGFSHVDNGLRFQFGITENDTRRICSAIDYAMDQALENGSTIVNWSEVELATCHLIGAQHRQAIINIAGQKMNTGELVGWQETFCVARKSDYNNEKSVWEFIQ